MKIGLEVHVALPTKSKLFCSCATYAEEPNSSICPICMGMPGSKPMLNKEALKIGLSVAAALKCKIKDRTAFVRKVYFYPDLPKGYQISQLYDAVGQGGYIDIDGKRIGIRRVQLEEDPAKIIREDDYTLLDFNRSGTPLLEIVTEPDITSEDELRAFNSELRSILYYFGIDIDREMKADLNISLDEARVEIKNVTGIKNLTDAARYEIRRQESLLKRGEKPITETRSYVPATMKTEHSREKESDEEYGYIFEPDLTFYSTKVEYTKPIFASAIAKDYAKRYGANEKTLRELIAYDRDALSLLASAAGKFNMQNIVEALEILKKYGALLTNERFSSLVKLVAGNSNIDAGVIKSLAEGKAVEVPSAVDDSVVENAIENTLSSNPGILEEIKKNPKSINMLIGKIAGETGASPKIVARIAQRVIGDKLK